MDELSKVDPASVRFADYELLQSLGEAKFLTLADLEPGLKVRIPKHNNRIATITAIEPFGTSGKKTVQYQWDDAPDFKGWHVMDPDLSYDWQIIPPPEREDTHTDTGGFYEESRSLTEGNVVVPEDAETIDLKNMPEEEIKDAYRRWVAAGMPNKDYGYKEHEYAIFARTTGPRDAEIDLYITLSWTVEIEAYLYGSEAGKLMVAVDAYQTPVDPDPILKAFSANAKSNKRILDAVADIRPDFIALFRAPEHEDVHTDTGGFYEESGKVSEVRAKTVYAPPRRAGSLPNFTANRSTTDELHREDYDSIVYDVSPYSFKVGRAELAAVSISFAVKCFANATSENPYEEGQGVKPLDGPPFYFLIISLRARDARYKDLKVFVKRYFDAAGDLCWVKARNLLTAPFVFYPLADPEHMEARAYGHTVPKRDGYFLALSSGSVADLVHDEIQRNLWKIFNPLIRELAAYPEVRKLEEPFSFTEHEDVHTDTGFHEEGLKREIQAITEMTEEEFDDLKPGDRIAYFDKKEYEVLSNSAANLISRPSTANTVIDVKPVDEEDNWPGLMPVPKKKYFFRDEAMYLDNLGPPAEHEDVHTDTGFYEASLMAENEKWKRFRINELYNLKKGDPVVIFIKEENEYWDATFDSFYRGKAAVQPADPAKIQHTLYTSPLTLQSRNKATHVLVDPSRVGYWLPPEHEDVHTDTGGFYEEGGPAKSDGRLGLKEPVPGD